MLFPIWTYQLGIQGDRAQRIFSGGGRNCFTQGAGNCSWFYFLDESQLKVFERQMNLLISEQIEIPENLLIDLSGLTALENQVASKLLAYVKETQMRDLSHLQEVEHYEIKDFLQMDFATKSSLELTANKRENKNMAHFIGCLMRRKQRWEPECYGRGLTALWFQIQPFKNEWKLFKFS